jgi:hypothetical protein
MYPEIFEYSCYLTFDPLSSEQLREIESLVKPLGISIDVGSQYLEFDYSGRDNNRKVVRLLHQLAGIIGDANGEVRCELAWEDSDPSFEFYSIKGGCLLLQKGYIVREEPVVLDASKLSLPEYSAA